MDLARRLGVFLEAGLVARVPTWFQIRQGELEMSPYLMRPDAGAEAGHDGRLLGHPLLRQPLLVSEIGWDHLLLGSGLGVELSSLCAHLQLTYRPDMPVYDLQLVQTHAGGLATLGAALDEMRRGTSARGRRRRRIAGRILARPDAYLERFFGPDGWLARAARFDYAPLCAGGDALPAEFRSLVAFLDYCASKFPAALRDIPPLRRPGHFLKLVTRRFRDRSLVPGD